MKNTHWNHLASIEVQVCKSTHCHLNSSALLEVPSPSCDSLLADTPLPASQFHCCCHLRRMSFRLYFHLVALSTIHQHDTSSSRISVGFSETSLLLLLLGLLLEPSTVGLIDLRSRNIRTRSVGLVVWSGAFRSSQYEYRLYLFDLRMVNMGSGLLMLADGRNQKGEGRDKRKTEIQRGLSVSMASCSQSTNTFVKPCRRERLVLGMADHPTTSNHVGTWKSFADSEFHSLTTVCPFRQHLKPRSATSSRIE